MLYILSGEDDFSLNQSLEEIKKGIGEAAILDAGTTALEGQQLKADQFKNVCETVPFLVEKRLVIVKGLLERFEAKERTGRRQKATPQADKQEENKPFASIINSIPDTTVLVLVDGKISNNNPLFKEISGKGEVRSFPFLKDARLRQWIQKRVQDEGGSISLQATELLAKLVGSDLWTMSGEINKLVMFTAGRRIEENDVKQVASYSQPTNVFAMVDAIVEFKTEKAEQLLEQLLQNGAAPAYLMVMLSRQVRMIVRAKELKAEGKSITEIQSQLGINAEFALRKTIEQSGRYTMARLREVYARLLEADLAIKTGRYDGELALEILVAELCQRGRASLTHIR